MLPIYEFALLLKPTKRNVLKAAVMFNDPLDLLTPITVWCKILFQAKKYFLQTTLFYEHLVKTRIKFLLDMPMLRELRFRRSVHCCTERKVQLHAFADSSGVTYCAVIYVRLCVFMR